MLHNIVKLAVNNRGQSMVEFALVLPILLLLVLGIVNFALVGFNMLLANEAAREGARAAAVSGKSASAVTAVKAVNASFLPKVTMAAKAGEPLTVEVKGFVQIVGPLFSTFISPNPFPVTAHSIMRQEVATVP